MCDLIKKNPEGIPTTYQQQGGKIVNINNLKDLHNNTYKFYMPPANTLTGMTEYTPTEVSYSRDYYNLIVYGDDPGVFTKPGHITLEKERCLVEENFISLDLKNKFSSLTKENIEELKSFLCLFASENKHSGWTEEKHYAVVGQLADIKIRSNGIELYYQPIFAVPQARINSLLPQLGICGRYKRHNELNRSHWAVKEIDLIEVIDDAGLNPFSR